MELKELRGNKRASVAPELNQSLAQEVNALTQTIAQLERARAQDQQLLLEKVGTCTAVSHRLQDQQIDSLASVIRMVSSVP